MEFGQTSKTYSLNKSTYINLRWIGIIGQFITINTVKFIFGFEFEFILSNIISLSLKFLFFIKNRSLNFVFITMILFFLDI